MINDFNNLDKENLNESNERLTERLDEFQENLYDSEYSDLQGIDKLKIQEGAVDELSKMRKAVIDKAKETLSDADIKETVSEFSKKFDKSKVLNEAGAEITEYTNKLGDTQEGTVNAKTGEKKEIVNHKAAIVNFPGVMEDKRWIDFLGENCFEDEYVHYRTSIEDYDEEKYIIYWCIQPDGRYWEDEDGFGGTNDCEITLYTFIDKEGNFTGPFQVYNVGPKYFL